MFNTKLKSQLQDCRQQADAMQSVLQALDKSMAVI